ncbi:NADH-cytochrome b5 reductase, partial [Hortaea werneckii]
MFSNRLFRPAQQLSGHVRRYATEPPKSGGSGAGLYGAIGAAALGGGYWYMNQGSHGSVNESAAHGQPASKTEEQNVPAKAGAGAVKTFTGGDQGFIPLVLDSTEQVSHNTKKLRFKLSSEDAVAGLPVASALITKYKGPEMEKPVIRPYTPVSDEDQPGYLDFVV